MKYLKKFNEELKASTYRSAARKISKLGTHPSLKKRASDLEKWADTVSSKEKITKWEKAVEKYSKFGSAVNITIGQFVAKFYLVLEFDKHVFVDNNDDDTMNIEFFIGIVPTDLETLNKCFDYLGEDDFSDGFFWAFTLMINNSIVDDTIQFEGIKIYKYEPSNDISMVGRPDANKLKTILYKIFTDESYNYPTYNNVDYTYDLINDSVFIEGGYSSRLGIDITDIGDIIKGVNVNSFLI